MKDLLFQISTFQSEIVRLLDEGKTISIEEFENISDSNDIVDYIGNTFGFKNINSKPENQDLLKAKLNETYISEGEAQKRAITNNGLVYLMDILFGIILNEAYDYKWNYEEGLNPTEQ